VQTPVGARCSECAKLYKLPTYRVSVQYYLRATGTALGIAIVCGVIWGVVANFLPFIFLNLLLGGGVGYVIGEIVSLSVNRKRGKGLAAIAGVGVAISYLVSIFLPWGLPLAFFHLSLLGIVIDLAAVALGIVIAVTRFR
jgi:hypothetical protein